MMINPPALPQKSAFSSARSDVDYLEGKQSRIDSTQPSISAADKRFVGSPYCLNVSRNEPSIIFLQASDDAFAGPPVEFTS
jgi:hypothetical protein